MRYIDAADLGSNCYPSGDDLVEIARRMTAAGYPTTTITDSYNGAPSSEEDMPSDLLWNIVDAVLPPERGGSSSASTVKWTQRTPADSERYIQVSDSHEMYYALLPEPLTAAEAIRQFIATYQFNRDEPREELEESLREDLSWQLHEAGEEEIDWEYSEEKEYFK